MHAGHDVTQQLLTEKLNILVELCMLFLPPSLLLLLHVQRIPPCCPVFSSRYCCFGLSFFVSFHAIFPIFDSILQALPFAQASLDLPGAPLKLLVSSCSCVLSATGRLLLASLA
jgi:hypothetical protein